MENPKDNELWFKDGLRFRCTMCGHCCTGAPGYVWVDDEEVQTIAAFHGDSPQEFLTLYTRRVGSRRSLRERANGNCVFYDKEVGCTIYPVRPRQCQTWPFWESNLRSEKTWQKTCAVCPGSGENDLIPIEEITRRMQVIKI